MPKKRNLTIGSNGNNETMVLKEVAPNAVTGKTKTNRMKGQRVKANLHDQLEGQLDHKELLRVLNEVKNGNFGVRMPIDQIGVSGKICDSLNEIISFNDRMMEEFTRAGNTIGKQGKLTQRIELPQARGAWSTGIESLNSLISDLVHPTIEIAHVISSVAKGNLSQQMPQEIGGRELQGEFARIAKEVNDMVKQLNLFSMEVTRVAREVGSEGKLGGQAKVKGVAGVWKDLTDSVNQMGSNLTAQVRNIAEVTTAVAKGDLSRKITVDVKGEILELKNTINTMVDQLNSFSSEVTRVAFMASHDLQEPLRKILTFSDRLNTKYGAQIDEEGKKFISRIKFATERLQVLIKDIMKFAKISLEKSAFEKSDLNQLVDEVLAEMEVAVHEKKAKISVEKLPSLYINPNLIRPLFYNLIHNALKYSKPDVVPHIHIYSDVDSTLTAKSNQDAGERYYRIYIEDNGIGFEQKYAEQIFEMFKRLHHHDEYEGTGIGLAFCKKIVEQHEGFISARSSPDQGSTFIISLPMHPGTNHLKQDQLPS